MAGPTRRLLASSTSTRRGSSRRARADSTCQRPSRPCWKDRDTLIVGGSFFGDAALTDSGYPRTAHLLKRGQKLEHAPLIYEGAKSDVSVNSYTYLDRGKRYTWRQRALTFYTTHYEIQLEGDAQPFHVVPVPADAQYAPRIASAIDLSPNPSPNAPL